MRSSSDGQPDVALERIRLAGEILVHALRLLLERVDPVGQQPLEPEGGALLAREGRALVVERRSQQMGAAIRDMSAVWFHG